jgi:hypothetical protein
LQRILDYACVSRVALADEHLQTRMIGELELDPVAAAS